MTSPAEFDVTCDKCTNQSGFQNVNRRRMQYNNRTEWWPLVIQPVYVFTCFSCGATKRFRRELFTGEFRQLDTSYFTRWNSLLVTAVAAMAAVALLTLFALGFVLVPIGKSLVAFLVCCCLAWALHTALGAIRTRRLIWNDPYLCFLQAEVVPLRKRLKFLDRSLVLGYSEKDVLTARAHMHINLGNKSEARRDFVKLVELDHADATTFQALANLSERPHDAEKYIAEAVRLAPNNAENHLKRAYILRRLGRNEDALALKPA